MEDDQDAASVLEAYLQRENFNVIVKYDGHEVLTQIRKKQNTPIIMLTAIGEPSEKIGALRYGADDYIVKPYHRGEVMGRIQSVLRRTQQTQENTKLLIYKNLIVDCTAMTARVDAQTLELTLTEFNVLATLLCSPLRVFTRFELLEICLPESNALERVVDTHIYNLRKKLEVYGVCQILINVRGIGYRFAHV
ncbi:winged helix-turn-helix domain-containing protein [Acinetobacter sp. HY1485]|uniref:winged helix-turn-helix domain-containing protein n=1 Tax=Acinetobacter sp. HY1485 TaxID=2970918 RepID=UPI0022B96A9E|nr:winged helix-turn-helix domain-containing protein [Acinetobacter sp. HY1485]